MSTFFEKLVAAVRFLGHYLWIALKALGRFLLWLGALLVRSLSNLITWIRLNLPPRVQFILLAVVVAILIVLVALVFILEFSYNNFNFLNYNIPLFFLNLRGILLLRRTLTLIIN